MQKRTQQVETAPPGRESCVFEESIEIGGGEEEEVAGRRDWRRGPRVPRRITFLFSSNKNDKLDNEDFLRKTDRAFFSLVVAEFPSTPATSAGDSNKRFL
jgi:hypothetical protein